MGELVKFSDRRKKVAVPVVERETDLSDIATMMSDIILGGAIEIPFSDALYDESRILVAGHSFADETRGADEVKVRLAYKLLFQARLSFIKRNISEADRRNALRELYEHTWDKAFDMGDEEFRLEIEGAIGNSYGLHDGGRILESLRLKRGISDALLQSPPPNIRELFPRG